MANEQLVSYIKEHLAKGYTKDELREVLLEHGWQPHDVDDAMTDTEMPRLATTLPSLVQLHETQSVEEKPSVTNTAATEQPEPAAEPVRPATQPMPSAEPAADKLGAVRESNTPPVTGGVSAAEATTQQAPLIDLHESLGLARPTPPGSTPAGTSAKPKSAEQFVVEPKTKHFNWRDVLVVVGMVLALCAVAYTVYMLLKH